LAGGAPFGIDAERVKQLGREVADVAARASSRVVVGGGNSFRGVAAAAQKMDRVTADQMGKCWPPFFSIPWRFPMRSERWAFNPGVMTAN